jgi:dTDP-4-dehydrorhamnose reductase
VGQIGAQRLISGLQTRPISVWAGFECTIARVGEVYRDQIAETGHLHRMSDLDLVADLGIKTLRYPVLWEQVAPSAIGERMWDWHDQRLSHLRALGIAPIAGLVHHGSGPRYTNLLDPAFPDLLAEYAGSVAERYPWIRMFTPVNEPLTTARFSCLYGHWYPHARDTGSFLRALFNQVRGTALAMRAIRRITPDARLVQTEDLGKTFSSAALRYQARYENARRWLSLDLLCGWVTPNHDWFKAFIKAGVDRHALTELSGNPCPPDIVGLNYYLSSDRFLDHRLSRYPAASHGGNGRHTYADVEAVRINRNEVSDGMFGRLAETWRRYKLPVAIAEVHNGCTREEQIRWLVEAGRTAERARIAGIDVRAMTVWALAGSVDWSSLLTLRNGHREAGAIEVRDNVPRRTALAAAAKALASDGVYDHPVLDGPGWWHRDMRFYDVPRRISAPVAVSARRMLVTGASGTLGRAFSRLCDLRGLLHELTGRSELDIADLSSVERALESHRPWAVINAAGYVRVPEAEREPERCHRENSAGAAILAQACARRGIPLLTFSSDLVFDGRIGRPYTETDEPCPTSVYGFSKAVAERLVAESWPQAIIVRTSALFGPWDRHNFIHKTLASLSTGRPLVVNDECRVSPTYVPDLVHRALDLLIDGESGIWHVANEGAISWGELAREAAARAGLNAELVIAEDGFTTSTELGSHRGPLLPPLQNALERFFREREV